MVRPLPKWIQSRYALLWKRFNKNKFSHEQAAKLLGDKKQVVSVFLSELKEAGWMEVSLDIKDSRIRYYRLKEPNKAIKEMERGV